MKESGWGGRVCQVEMSCVVIESPCEAHKCSFV